MSEHFRVPKSKVEVEVRDATGETECFFLFVGERAEDHEGPEGPLDLLNAPGDFVVAQDADGGVAFLQRSKIRIVTLADAPRGRDASGFEVEATLRVALDDGSVLEGQCHYELPPERQRVQDFLNGDDRFFALRHAARIVCINKACVTRVTPL